MEESFIRLKARCSDHSECDRGLIFDLECKRVLFRECRNPPNNHKHHKKEIIDIVLENTDVQMQAICNIYPPIGCCTTGGSRYFAQRAGGSRNARKRTHRSG